MQQMLQAGLGALPGMPQGNPAVALGQGPTMVRLGGISGPVITLTPAARAADQPNQVRVGSVCRMLCISPMLPSFHYLLQKEG